MSWITPLKYFSVFSLPLLAYIAFTFQGWLTFAPMIGAFVLVPVLSPENEMIQFLVIQLALLGRIYFIFELTVLLWFILAAVMGFLLLETVNYIEYYGLRRARTERGYEWVMLVHSWNSDHVVGRLMLFEMSRHSDHHFVASRKYQILRHMDDGSQISTGYPGMMDMATVPPFWYLLMNERFRKYD